MWRPALTGTVLLAVFVLRIALGEASPVKVPKRVVSMNVCTDQLAMMLAGDGQLYSVSWLAADPGISVLSENAKGLILNHGLAEEIFLMQPDLVIAGTYTTRATVNLLKKTGIRVEEFPPAASFQDIGKNIRRMAALLGSPEKGERLVRAFQGDLKKLSEKPPGEKRIALYYANSYTSGAGTLADEIVGASGLRNLGKELGYTGTTKLPLELLVANQPDFVVGRERDFGKPSKAEENFNHPAYRAIAGGGHGISIESKYWVCGAPFVLDVSRKLRDHADGN
ncbi:MAG: ABC transporter substrate-binding protein [Rhizobiaceae bacterium]|jgi:iron complex transport system substrate-binding protein|nr:ABC transporter substrate-binding protein [Rhizobiaceae bacterium]